MSGTALRAVNAWYWRENGEGLTRAALTRVEQDRLANEVERDRLKASQDVQARQAEAVRILQDNYNLPQRRAHEDKQREAEAARAAFEKADEKRGWFTRNFDRERNEERKRVESLEAAAEDLRETAEIAAAPPKERRKERERVKLQVDKESHRTTLALESNQDRDDALSRLKYRIVMDQERAPELVRAIMRGDNETGVDRGLRVMEQAEHAAEHAREAKAEERRAAYRVTVHDFEGTRSGGKEDPHDLQGAYHWLAEQREQVKEGPRREENHQDMKMLYRHRYSLEHAAEQIVHARATYENDQHYTNADKVLQTQAAYDTMEAGFAKEAWRRVAERGESRPDWNHASRVEDARDHAEAAGEAEQDSRKREERIEDMEISTVTKVTRARVPGGEDMTYYDGFRPDDGRVMQEFDNKQVEADYAKKRDKLNEQKAALREQREGRTPSDEERPEQHAPEEKPEQEEDDRPVQHAPMGKEEHAATFQRHEGLDRQAHEEAINPKEPTNDPTDDDIVKR